MAEASLVQKPRYAGFWIRLVGHMWDGLIFSPIGLYTLWLMRHDRLLYDIFTIASYGLFVYFNILFVKWRGGSPGKIISGLRIVTTDFKSVGWKQAWLREGVGLGINVLSTAVHLIALGKLSENEFLHLGMTESVRRQYELGGIAMDVTTWLSYGWTVGELIVLLTNRRRRALHDFIAGTVVIREGKERGCILGIIGLIGNLILGYAFLWLHKIS
jgi:uncharacterized RDD family membrane protein YckC